DMMAEALKTEGIDLVHIIGAGAGHQYTPEARVEINQRIDQIARVGREPLPSVVRFTTWTLRYNRCSWVQIDGLEKHWERARVEAELSSSHGGTPGISTRNVDALTLAIPSGLCPLAFFERPGERFAIELDDSIVEVPRPMSDRSWTVHLRKVEGRWQVVQ